MLLRLAATGKKATPPLFETLAVLGPRAGAPPHPPMRRVHQKDAGPQAPEPSGRGAPTSRRGRAARRASRSASTSTSRSAGVRCPYCDFAVDTRDRDPARRLRRRGRSPSSARARALVRRARARCVSIYFGGGTPGLWRPDALGAGDRRRRAPRSARPAGRRAGDHRRGQPRRGRRARSLRRAARAPGVNRLSTGRAGARRSPAGGARAQPRRGRRSRPPSRRRARPGSTTCRSISMFGVPGPVARRLAPQRRRRRSRSRPSTSRPTR